jgi:hypothetical protein
MAPQLTKPGDGIAWDRWQMEPSISETSLTRARLNQKNGAHASEASVALGVRARGNAGRMRVLARGQEPLLGASCRPDRASRVRETTQTSWPAASTLPPPAHPSWLPTCRPTYLPPRGAEITTTPTAYLFSGSGPGQIGQDEELRGEQHVIGSTSLSPVTRRRCTSRSTSARLSRLRLCPRGHAWNAFRSGSSRSLALSLPSPPRALLPHLSVEPVAASAIATASRVFSSRKRGAINHRETRHGRLP